MSHAQVRHRHVPAALVCLAGLCLPTIAIGQAPPPTAAPPAPAAEVPALTPAMKAAIAAPAVANTEDLSAIIGARLARLHSLASQSPVELLSSLKVGAVYKVVLQMTRPKVRPELLVVSGNGEFIMQGALNLKQELRQVKADRRFARCLAQKGLKIYLAARRGEFTKQSRELGRFPEKVIVVCQPKGQDPCKAAGVDKTPMLVLGKRRFEGQRSRRFIEALTGCR